MSQKDHLPVFPSRANAVAMKGRIHSANTGLTLLKKKRDAIELKVRELKEEAYKLADTIRPLLLEAYMSLSHARYLGADLEVLKATRPRTANAYCLISACRQIGVSIPVVNLILQPSNDFALSSMGRGGTALKQTRLQFQEVLKKIIKIAEIQDSIDLLHISLHENNMRVNGVEYVVLPLLVNTQKYILNELDEMEREDFYRLKCSKAKQERLRAQHRKLVQMKNENQAVPLDDANLDPQFNLDAFENGAPRAELRTARNSLMARASQDTRASETPRLSQTPNNLQTENFDDGKLVTKRERDPLWEFWTFSSTYLQHVQHTDTKPQHRHIKRKRNLLRTDEVAQTDFDDQIPERQW